MTELKFDKEILEEKKRKHFLSAFLKKGFKSPQGLIRSRLNIAPVSNFGLKKKL